MIKVDLTFNRCTERLPSESGRYLVYTTYGAITTLDYSVKHQGWNCRDDAIEPELIIGIDDDFVIAWAPLESALSLLECWRYTE